VLVPVLKRWILWISRVFKATVKRIIDFNNCFVSEVRVNVLVLFCKITFGRPATLVRERSMSVLNLMV
jgi:hypothetical protein